MPSLSALFAEHENDRRIQADYMGDVFFNLTELKSQVDQKLQTTLDMCEAFEARLLERAA